MNKLILVLQEAACVLLISGGYFSGIHDENH